MTKGELRKARKATRAEGRRLDGDLALPNQPAQEFTETRRGYEAREREWECEGCRTDSWCRGGDCANNAAPTGARAE